LHIDSDLENKKTKWILEGIINIAKKLNIRVVVEGVESSKDDEFIRCLGANVPMWDKDIIIVVLYQ